MILKTLSNIPSIKIISIENKIKQNANRHFKKIENKIQNNYNFSKNVYFEFSFDDMF